MYAPKGFTKSVTIATKIAIWSQPLNVIRKCSSEPLRLKLFRADQRVDEIDQQAERHRCGEAIIDDHFEAPQTRSQPTVYRTATTKKAQPTATMITSSITHLLGQRPRIRSKL